VAQPGSASALGAEGPRFEPRGRRDLDEPPRKTPETSEEGEAPRSSIRATQRSKEYQDEDTKVGRGAWRSPVARRLWEPKVPGSNPGAPIKDPGTARAVPGLSFYRAPGSPSTNLKSGAAKIRRGG
jgi:hypothetical protein